MIILIFTQRAHTDYYSCTILSESSLIMIIPISTLRAHTDYYSCTILSESSLTIFILLE